MRRRLIDAHEPWLLDWPLWLALPALLWRAGAWLFLWGGMRNPWPPLVLLDARAMALLAALSLLLLLRCLLPREYSAAAALPLSACCLWLTAEQLPRFGLLLDWPLGILAPGWYVLAGLLLLLALLLPAGLQLYWRKQLRGHGIEWTRRWAEGRSYGARQLARRALSYMGDDGEADES